MTITYKELTPEQFIKVMKALRNGTRHEEALVEDMLNDSIYLNDEQKYLALDYAGVDNWGGYDYAIESAEEDGFDWSELSDAEKLNYLENAGVDNWGYYGDAFEDYKLNYYDNYLLEDTDLVEENLKDYLADYKEGAELFNAKIKELFGYK